MKAFEVLWKLKDIAQVYFSSLSNGGAASIATDAQGRSTETLIADAVSVLTSPAFADFRTVLGDFAETFSAKDDLPGVIDELSRKREEIRNNRTLRELSDDELVNYAALGDLRHVMTAEHLHVTMTHASLEDFIRVVIPLIKELAPIALMLL